VVEKVPFLSKFLSLLVESKFLFRGGFEVSFGKPKRDREVACYP